MITWYIKKRKNYNYFRYQYAITEITPKRKPKYYTIQKVITIMWVPFFRDIDKFVYKTKQHAIRTLERRARKDFLVYLQQKKSQQN